MLNLLRQVYGPESLSYRGNGARLTEGADNGKGDVSKQSISIVVNGKTYNGSYGISGKLLTVSYGGDSKKTQVGNLPPETLARMMLGELVASSRH